MELFILRHGIAVERGDPGCARDRDRPLTPEGRRKTRAVAKAMRALGLDFDAILSSPYARARQTAEIVARVFKARKKLEFTDHLACEGDPRKLVAEVRRKHGDCGSVLLVGHEPYLSGFVSTLLCGDPGLPIELKKGGLCHLSVEGLTHGRCAALRSLMGPAQLTRLK